MQFYVGCHQPSDCRHFERSFVSINRLRQRRSPFQVGRWVMDSGAFTELTTHGRYRHDVSDYAEAARRWIDNGQLDAIVAQDYMCEPFALSKTGMTVAEHQRLTIERYDALVACQPGAYVLPVLQGWTPDDYAHHVEQYGGRFHRSAWVGVGSVCKRQGDPMQVRAVLKAIHHVRPDLRLHGFGVKTTTLIDPRVRHLLYSADSMAWSYAARKQGRNGNDWREAERFRQRIDRPASVALTLWGQP